MLVVRHPGSCRSSHIPKAEAAPSLSTPKSSKSENSESESDSDIQDRVRETDGERRKIMLDAAQADDLDDLKFIDDFQFMFPPSGGSKSDAVLDPSSSLSNGKGKFKSCT